MYIINKEKVKIMVEGKKVEGKKEEQGKGYSFECGGCGKQWTHKVKNTSGLCKGCVELRRSVQGFLNKGLYSKAEALTIQAKF